MRQPSRQQILTLTLCSAFCLISAIPLPQPAGNQELDLLQIPLANGKEIDVLTLGAKDQEQLIADRNKRTIGLLRELFPDITKEIDSIVNRIIAQVIRVAGPGLLNSVLAGNRGGAGGGRSTTPASDFDADFEDDSFDSDDEEGASSSSTAAPPSGGGAKDESSRVKIDLPTFAPDATENKVSARESLTNVASSSSETTATTSTTSTTTLSPNPSYPTANPEEQKLLPTLLPRFLEPATTTTTSTTTTTTTTTPATTTIITTTTDNPPPLPTTTIQNSIEETQLLTIIADINRLLNSTNYFITTRDNDTTTTTTTTMAPTIIDNNNITKLRPVFD